MKIPCYLVPVYIRTDVNSNSKEVFIFGVPVYARIDSTAPGSFKVKAKC